MFVLMKTHTLRLVAFAIASALLAGCGGYGGYCTDRADCRGGNDADIDACVIRANEDEDLASVRGCDDFFSDYRACLDERATCNGDDFGDHGACKREADRLHACMD